MLLSIFVHAAPLVHAIAKMFMYLFLTSGEVVRVAEASPLDFSGASVAAHAVPNLDLCILQAGRRLMCIVSP